VNNAVDKTLEGTIDAIDFHDIVHKNIELEIKVGECGYRLIKQKKRYILRTVIIIIPTLTLIGMNIAQFLA